MEMAEMTLIKICGITEAQTLADIHSLPIDYLGFVFAPSTRRVDSKQASALIAAMRRLFTVPPQAVGVFRNPSEIELRDILRDVPLDVVQFHGDESPALCLHVKQTYNIKVMKVFSLQASSDEQQIIDAARAYLGTIDLMLIDTHDPHYGGGSGKTFRWQVIDPIRDWCEQAGLPLLVAGGLHADNVLELLYTYRPAGVDVSSGVETEGRKQPEKIKTFTERVRAYDNRS